jgi:phenylacetate-CoA ligase
VSDPSSERLLWLIADMARVRRSGASAVTTRARARLADQVAFARSRSRLYRELYAGLPERVDDVRALPVVRKTDLMGRFDEWVTDAEVRHDALRAFVENPSLVGEYFLGRYTAATTSGTTGAKGMFLIDDRSMRVTTALAVRMLRDWLGPKDVLKVIRGGRRVAMLMAAGGHFASATAAARLTRDRRSVRAFPVQTPLRELVGQLNEFQPVIVAPYASTASILATEQAAGRLNIHPALVVPSAEGLAPTEYGRIAEAFGAKVRDSYAATECPFLSYRCGEGWLHVNADWAILEAVDEQYQPVAPGTASHTVLLTNLANRVQPILRYDLGDSIMTRPDPCPCGNPLPAILVRGRSADVLRLVGSDGRTLDVAPLSFVTLLETIAGIERLQVVQTGPAKLEIRARFLPNADSEATWAALFEAVRHLLRDQGLANVETERADEPPRVSAGGKYRAVVPSSSAAS